MTRSWRWLHAVIRTARPRQWPKNLLVFAAPLAAGQLHRWPDLVVATAGFGCASAAVYFVNDVADVERDRAHPVKRSRPVAAGLLSGGHALVIAALAALAGLASGVLIGAPLLSAVIACYLVISFSYSARLKHVPVLELGALASGFLLRVLGGAAAIRVPVSGWFLLVCSLGALGVAVAKRYAELITLGARDAARHRPAARRYRPGALRKAQYLIGAGTLICYALWAAGEPPDARIWHLASVLPLAAALTRFALLTGRGSGWGALRPVEDLITRDWVMLTCEAGWLALFVTGLLW